MTTETTAGPVLAAHRWETNADLIFDCHRLGYLRDDWRILDPTYGRGIWWKKWRPTGLVAHDLDPTKSPNGEAIDVRHMPYPDAAFHAVAYDPAYVSPGGRKTSTVDEFNDRFGLHTTPKTPEENQQVINDGITECHRVLMRGGILLVKCMDYISSGKLFPGTYFTIRHAVDGVGMQLVDRFEHVGDPGMQPDKNPDGTPRRQVHARRNLSTLLVFRRTAPIQHPSLDL